MTKSPNKGPRLSDYVIAGALFLACIYGVYSAIHAVTHFVAEVFC